MTVYYMSKMTSNKAKTVLVVDDEEENLRSYEEVLHDMGYQVLLQPDGVSALAFLREDIGVDLIITDFRMPGMNGIEFITDLRQSRPFVPVIMITAYGNIETYLHSVSLGVFEYVHKPVKKEEFERIVKHALHEAGQESASDEAWL
jgi:two-component system response regulator (stage 0 sporulation protein F)